MGVHARSVALFFLKAAIIWPKRVRPKRECARASVLLIPPPPLAREAPTRGSAAARPRTRMAEAYTSSRAVAAAAAQAHAIVPINAKSTRKRKGVSGAGVAPVESRCLPTTPKDDDDELLSREGALDGDEVYSEQEKALNEFLRLHPMLSLCAAQPLPPLPPRHTRQFVRAPTKMARSTSGT